jgi:BMFP domain-containing protein YqiC
MFRRSLAYLLAFWAALAVFSPAFGAEPVFPPGLRIGLVPAGDLKPSTRFPGFEDIDRKVTVTIFDLPAGAYAELERAARAENQRDLTDVKREDFSFRSGAGMLVSARAQLGNVKLHKWILLATAAADQNLTALIAVEVPDAVLADYPDAAIRQALASVTFRPTPIKEQLGLLPFKVNQLAGFRVVKVLAAGVIMTEGPNDDIGTQPYVTVSIGGGAPEQADDRARFARDLLTSVPFRDLRLQSADAMRIGGLPGYEIRAQAKGFNDETLSLVQWVRFGGGGFLRVVGVSRKDDWDALFTRFRAVRDGIEPR